MFYLILFLLLALFYFAFNRFLERNLNLERAKFSQLEREVLVLSQRESDLKSQNNLLSEKAESVIELYEITKDVCKSIEENIVFDIFVERLKHYIKFGAIKLVKGDLDYQLYKNELIFPLDIGIKPTFFLVAEDVAQKDQEKFYILAQQFLLGFRRAALYRRIQDLAIHDSLTGVLTRRYFLMRLEEELRRAERLKLNFSFLMVDIDHFKECNDQYGHLVGDVVLRDVATVIKDNTRLIDVVGRYGGEEFSIVLSETAKEGAFNASWRILKSVEGRRIKAYDEELNLTISIGIAGFPEDASTIKELIDKSDRALYHAKQTGRDKICVWGIEK